MEEETIIKEEDNSANWWNKNLRSNIFGLFKVFGVIAFLFFGWAFLSDIDNISDILFLACLLLSYLIPVFLLYVMFYFLAKFSDKSEFKKTGNYYSIETKDDIEHFIAYPAFLFSIFIWLAMAYYMLSTSGIL